VHEAETRTTAAALLGCYCLDTHAKCGGGVDLVPPLTKVVTGPPPLDTIARIAYSGQTSGTLAQRPQVKRTTPNKAEGRMQSVSRDGSHVTVLT
jgi:hypothetical protein